MTSEEKLKMSLLSTDDDYLETLGGHEFENLIIQLLKKMGFIIEERKLTVDGGIDILAQTDEALFKGIYVIQCKRLAQKVGEPVIRDLYGVVHARNANKGILITNSSFSQAATNFARNRQLELIDGKSLRTLLSKYDIVKRRNGLNFSNSTMYMLNHLVPSIKKVREQIQDIKDHRIYLESVVVDDLKEWAKVQKDAFTGIEAYVEFLKNAIPLLDSFLADRNADLEKVKSCCDRIMEATDRQVAYFKQLWRTVPLQKFKKVHQCLLDIFGFYLEALFHWAEEFEELFSLPEAELRWKAGQQKKIAMAINMDLPRDLQIALGEAIKEALTAQ